MPRRSYEPEARNRARRRMRLDPPPRAAPVILAVDRVHHAARCARRVGAGTWSMDPGQGMAGAKSHRARLDTDPERRAPGKALAVGRYLARRPADCAAPWHRAVRAG